MSRFTKSSNPLFKEDTFVKEKAKGSIIAETATISGAINRTFTLFGIMMITSVISYVMPSPFLMIGGAIGGLILFFVAMFKPHTSPITAPGYAAFEGLFVGSITAVYAQAFDGIVFQAVALTFSTLFMMLILYRSGLITITKKFRAGVYMATGAIFVVYMFSFIGGFFGLSVPFLHDSGPLGIGICLVFIGVAALNLLLDFDMIEKAEQEGAPKYMEWFCGMALLVTLVWLYIEFLRLLSKLRD